MRFDEEGEGRADGHGGGGAQVFGGDVPALWHRHRVHGDVAGQPRTDHRRPLGFGGRFNMQWYNRTEIMKYLMTSIKTT